MATTIPQVPNFTGEIAQRTDPTTFAERADPQYAYQAQLSVDLNTTVDAINVVSGEVETAAAEAEQAAATAAAAANFVGRWDEATGAATKGSVYYHNGQNWQLLDGISDIAASEPSNSNSQWLDLVGLLKTVAVSAGTTVENVMLATNTTDAIVGYIYDADEQVTYLVPSDAQGKFIGSVVGFTLTTSDASTYTLETSDKFIKSFSTADSLIASTDVYVGDAVKIKDRGQLTYSIIETATANGYNIIALNNGLFASLDLQPQINIKQLGAKEGSSNDIGPLLNSIKDIFNGYAGIELYITPKTEYHINTNVIFDGVRNLKLKGIGGRGGVIKTSLIEGDLIQFLNDSYDSEVIGIRFLHTSPNKQNSLDVLSYTTDNGTFPVRPSVHGCDADGFARFVNVRAGGNLSMTECYTNRMWKSSLSIAGLSDGAGGVYNVSENRVRMCRFSLHTSYNEAQVAPQVHVKSGGALRMYQTDITGGTVNLLVNETISGAIPANVWCFQTVFGGLTNNAALSLQAGTQNAKFEDCVFEAAGAEGIDIDGASYIDIKGGMVRTNEGDGISIRNLVDSNITIKGVRISANGKDNVGDKDEVRVVSIDADSSVVISGNEIGERFTADSNKARYCVNNATGVAGVVRLSDNQFGGYVNGDINNSGSLTGTVSEFGNYDFGA